MEGKSRVGLSSLLVRSPFENNQYALALSFMSGPADTSSIFFLVCSILGVNASSKKRKDFSKCWATKQHSNSDRRVCPLKHGGLFCFVFSSYCNLLFLGHNLSWEFKSQIIVLCFHNWINFLSCDFYQFLSRVGILSLEWELQWKIRNLFRWGLCFAQRWCLLVWSPHAYANTYSSSGWWGWWDHLPQWPSSPQYWQFPWYRLSSGCPSANHASHTFQWWCFPLAWALTRQWHFSGFCVLLWQPTASSTFSCPCLEPAE